jgi:hypothetical protein
MKAIKNLNFCLYGKICGSISMKEIKKLKNDFSIFARAEYSGAEGCYCEVARWNEEKRVYQRFAFVKFFDGDLGGNSALDCAKQTAEYINGNDDYTIIHHLENYSE